MEKKGQLNEIEIKERNEQIALRYRTLAEEQPLATHYKILTYLAREYNLTPQYIGKIVNEQNNQDNETL